MQKGSDPVGAFPVFRRCSRGLRITAMVVTRSDSHCSEARHASNGPLHRATARLPSSPHPAAQSLTHASWQRRASASASTRHRAHCAAHDAGSHRSDPAGRRGRRRLHQPFPRVGAHTHNPTRAPCSSAKPNPTTEDEEPTLPALARPQQQLRAGRAALTRCLSHRGFVSLAEHAPANVVRSLRIGGTERTRGTNDSSNTGQRR